VYVAEPPVRVMREAYVTSSLIAAKGEAQMRAFDRGRELEDDRMVA